MEQASVLMENVVKDSTVEGRKERECALDELLIGFRLAWANKRKELKKEGKKMGFCRFLRESAKRKAAKDKKRQDELYEQEERRQALMREDWLQKAREAERLENERFDAAEEELRGWAAEQDLEAGAVVVQQQSEVLVPGHGVLPRATGSKVAREFEPFRISDVNRMVDLLRGDDAKMVMPYTIKGLVKYFAGVFTKQEPRVLVVMVQVLVASMGLLLDLSNEDVLAEKLEEEWDDQEVKRNHEVFSSRVARCVIGMAVTTAEDVTGSMTKGYSMGDLSWMPLKPELPIASLGCRWGQ